MARAGVGAFRMQEKGRVLKVADLPVRVDRSLIE